MAIINPLRPRMGKRSTLTIAASIWLFSIFLSVPMAYVHTTGEVKSVVEQETITRTVCYGVWPDGESSNSYMENV